MKISHLQENLTPASAPSAPTPGPKFGRSDEMLESGASTTTAGVMSIGTPTNMGVQRRSKKGSDLLKGIKTSEKYANSRKAGISEDAINEDDLSEEQLQAKQKQKELFNRSKDREIGKKPMSREIMAKEEEYKGSAGAQAIQQANPDKITDVNKIRAGDTINLPGVGEYKIKKGDALDRIARDNLPSTAPQTQTQPPQVQKTQPPVAVQKTEPPVQKTEPPVQKTEPPVQKAEPVASPGTANAATAPAPDTSKSFTPPATRSKGALDYVKDFGKASASLGDNIIDTGTGVLDQLAYGPARAYHGIKNQITGKGTPDDAAYKAYADTRSPKQMLGRAFGIQNDPAYNNEISRQATDTLGAVVQPIKAGVTKVGNDLTGVPEPDIDNMLNYLPVVGKNPIARGTRNALSKGFDKATTAVRGVDPAGVPVPPKVQPYKPSNKTPINRDIDPPMNNPAVWKNNRSPNQPATSAPPTKTGPTDLKSVDPSWSAPAAKSKRPNYNQNNRRSIDAGDFYPEGYVNKLTNEYEQILESIVDEESKGLWANIHAKQNRIKHGSGEKMRKPGSKGAPTADALRKSAK